MKIHKNAPMNGVIHIPGDKSISHRSVMFGAIADGTTVVKNFLPGADCLSTIDCFRKMGVEIEQKGTDVVIHGKGLKELKEPSDVLDVGNSGTTIRLMMGILAGCEFHSTLIGDESIAKRPMQRVTGPLKQLGAKIDGRANGEYTPLSIRGGHLKGISYESPVASAQIKSAVLLAGLQAEGTTTLTEPHKSRDHTERMLSMFGVKLDEDEQSVSIEGGQTLKATDIFVPGDISSAAFFLVAGSIVPNSRIVLKNVGLNKTRTGIIDVLKQMGANLEIKEGDAKEGEPYGDLTISTSSLKGIEISGDMISRLIDEIPIIALLATQAEGTTIIKDAAELKVKETNRIDTVVSELKKLGADIEATDDGMKIHGKTTLQGGVVVSSYGDHRIGMMLGVAACITKQAVEIEDTDAVRVSYPNFFEHIEYLTKTV
ncbi:MULTISPECIES: 3-phosphoshikimate 1-carboxyvinyltransferase [unclassified Bacillus (in: firmicutes)]|uniref:3-phosphoshikimate 1-carboxyvinyltransferase n=1 Tax=unclassified Bacillus (in: firmicutes) TaxID=185979 RepID=UPI000D037361|nr:MULTISPECIES: 3-phosphoshikimate 1-carboxyvinyltransferase [unclassified Bacillus (in: firmicutes)]PRS83656.1 3-phosphoshikimate 1-carboxyvinyltransferase [Bacillus sp. CJCL2]PRS88402.1 3-phosphoshikimate 1-carboxyvinyltransferase [Bacillus sp. YBWC18]